MRIQSKTKYECTFVNNETRWKKKTSSPVLIPKQEGPSVAVDENNNKCQVMRNRWEPARGDLSLSLSLRPMNMLMATSDLKWQPTCSCLCATRSALSTTKKPANETWARRLKQTLVFVSPLYFYFYFSFFHPTSSKGNERNDIGLQLSFPFEEFLFHPCQVWSHEPIHDVSKEIKVWFSSLSSCLLYRSKNTWNVHSFPFK